MMSVRSLLRQFGADQRGVSAVEFGLIAPILAMLVLGVAELGHVTYQRTDMHSAVRSGAQYVLNGGRDVDIAQEIVERSWSSMPDDGEVEATRFCLCGASQHACNTPCSDNSVPEAFIQLRATATLGGIAYNYGHSADDAVRIR
jgi:Flp pilus assembly pilin Flp